MQLCIQKYAEYIQNAELQNNTGLTVIKKCHKNSRHPYEYFYSKVHPCTREKKMVRTKKNAGLIITVCTSMTGKNDD